MKIASSVDAAHDETAYVLGVDDFGVHRDVAAEKELDSHVDQLLGEIEDVLDQAQREISSGTDVEVERLRREKDALLWG